MTDIQISFSTIYADKTYQNPATARHNGSVIAFAMDENCKIYYTVLDINTPDAKPIDAENWLKEPKQLLFANEITQVGYGGFDLTTLPVVKKNGDVVIPGTRVQPQELDSFQSSTARLTANAPFQVMSDDQYLYVFRQAIAADHSRMVFKQNADGTEITDADGKKVPLVNSTLLLDRFVLSGTDLQPKLEVRYQRSRSKSRPQSNKDSLSAKDMEGKPFYEPTQELDFIRHLSEGCFTVLLLPTQIPEQKRWQIFAYNSQTTLMDAYNIKQSGDGLFNTRDLDVLQQVAGILEPIETLRSSFALRDRTITAGMSALLYFQQETASMGYDNAEKPLKKSARVMLAVGTKATGSDLQETAIVDFGVARTGRISQLPDALDLPAIDPIANKNTISFDQAMLRLSPVEAAVQRLQAELQLLQQEVKQLQGSVQSLQGTIQAIEQEIAQRMAAGEINDDYGRYLLSMRSADLDNELNNLRYPQSQLAVKQTELAAKQQELERNQQELAQLKAIAQGTRQFPMPLIYTDSMGLTVSGTAFNLTASKDTPRLFDSANGNLILYFRGANDEFYSAQYDTLTERVSHELAATEGNLVFIARTAGSQIDTATIVIQSSSTDTDETCTVVLSNPVMGITETWNKVPRQVAQFAQVINGEANNSQDASYYDYSANVKVKGITSSSQFQGSLLFVVANNAKGLVKDGAIQGSEVKVKTRSAQWTSLPLGNALQFDGKDDFVSPKPDSQLSSFDAAGDLTLEAWVKPMHREQEGTSRLIGHRSDRSQYSLALEPFASSWGAIKMDGQTVFQLEDISFGDTSFTIEFWAKQDNVNQSGQIFGEAWQGEFERFSNYKEGLALQFQENQLTWLSTVNSSLTALSTPEYPDTNWHHWACTYDRSMKVREIYCDGGLVAQDTLPGQAEVYTSAPILGGLDSVSYSPGSFKGSLDEIRVWNYVRPAKQINSDMHRHLRSSQPGLQACWGMW